MATNQSLERMNFKSMIRSYSSPQKEGILHNPIHCIKRASTRQTDRNDQETTLKITYIEQDIDKAHESKEIKLPGDLQ